VGKLALKQEPSPGADVAQILPPLFFTSCADLVSSLFQLIFQDAAKTGIIVGDQYFRPGHTLYLKDEL
jgi:hypothetical protein